VTVNTQGNTQGKTQDGPVRAAVVGAGHLGKIHARIYSETPDVRLTAVVDVNRDRANEVAVKYGAQALDSADRLPADVDVVSVTTPATAHASVAVPLLRRGVSVLVEKPIALTVAEADSMIAAANEGGSLLSVGHSERFNPALNAIRDFQLEPQFVEIHRLSPFSLRSGDVGVVLDLMIHDLDLLLTIVDSPVVHIDAVGVSVLTSHEDLVNARIRFENGCIANLTASRVSLEPMRRTRFFSPHGYVSLDLMKRYALLVKKGPKFDERRASFESMQASSLPNPGLLAALGLFDIREIKAEPGDEPLRVEISGFLAARAGRGPNLCTGEEGRRALALAEQILRSMDRRTVER
jgi:predicted dehydrogenase